VSYPVTFEADYVEKRSRLTTFFRLILAIPLAIVLWVYGVLATIAVVIAWFAIVITARYPSGLYNFVAGFTRFATRFIGYTALLCDPYPSFWGEDDDAYPVRLHFAGPLDPYSRVKTLFRVILAIPIVILRYVMNLLLEVGAIAAWFVILIVGKMPRSLFDVMVLAQSYIARSDTYLFLLTETYPPFQDEQTRAAGLDAPAGAAPLASAASEGLPAGTTSTVQPPAPAEGGPSAPGQPPAGEPPPPTPTP
jgi:hypothetical protein